MLYHQKCLLFGDSFTTNWAYNDIVVCSFSCNTTKFVHERIFPDMNHLEAQVSELTTFWRTLILPEILGGWYTKKAVVSETV